MNLVPVIIQEKDPRGHTVMTDDLPSVVDSSKIAVRENTILDPKIWKNGAWIEFPIVLSDYAGRDCDRMYVPPIRPMEENGTYTVHPVMYTANQLVRVIQQITKGTTPMHALQNMAIAYQRQAIAALAGKEGLVRRVVIGARIKQSGRAVLVPNADHDPSYVGIPGKFFDDNSLKHGDMILIGRDPTIWDGSTEILFARKSNSDAIELHPLLFAQLGADCDGDTIYWFPIPKDEACQEEATRELLSFCKSHAVFSKQLLQKDSTSTIDWAHAKEDTKHRLEPTGFSIGPEDVLAQTEQFWTSIARTTGKKDLHRDCLIMASGLPEDKWISKVLDKNFEMLTMKKLMGPIGAACNRMKILAGWNNSWLASANYISERLQQLLLDSKHGDGYDPFYVLNILNRKGPWMHASVDEALKALEEVGIEPTHAGNMVLAIYRLFPIRMAIEEILPADRDLRKYQRLLVNGCSMPWEHVRQKLNQYLHDDKIDYEMTARFREIVLDNPVGLTDIAMKYCPLHELIASTRYENVLVKRVISQNDVDTFGVCRRAWSIHMERLTGESK